MKKKYKIRKYSIAWFAIAFWDNMPVIALVLIACKLYR